MCLFNREHVSFTDTYTHTHTLFSLLFGDEELVMLQKTSGDATWKQRKGGSGKAPLSWNKMCQHWCHLSQGLWLAYLWSPWYQIWPRWVLVIVYQCRLQCLLQVVSSQQLLGNFWSCVVLAFRTKVFRNRNCEHYSQTLFRMNVCMLHRKLRLRQRFVTYCV